MKINALEDLGSIFGPWKSQLTNLQFEELRLCCSSVFDKRHVLYEKCFATLLCKNGLGGLSPYVFPIQRFFALLRFDWKVHK